MKVSDLLRTFVSISGRYCLCCNKAIYPNYIDSLCQECKSKITFLDSNPLKHQMNNFSFDDLLACCIYGYEARQIVGSFKSGKTYYARPIANLMTDRFVRSGIQVDAICFVPSDKEKAAYQRGFVPTKMLTNTIAQKTSLPILNVLEKKASTKSNRLSSKEARGMNVKGVFSVKRNKEKELFGKDILLVDDVITTGSTADEVAWVLKKAGANKVYLLCFASGSGSSRYEGRF